MADGLEELEERANARRRGRQPGGSRNARNREEEERKRREKELEERERERKRRAEEERRREDQERQAQEAEAEDLPPEPEPEPETEPEPESPNWNAGGAAPRRRPPSIPFYYDSDNESFLWEITQEAASRRTKVPVSAVLRLAMRRLQDQMPVERIVQELGGPSPVTGKRGRPRR
jgi:hypothetical protein